MTVQATFLCDLPNYRPSDVAMRTYERISEITYGTHIIGGLLNAGWVVQLLGGRSAKSIVLPAKYSTFAQMAQAGENIKTADTRLLVKSFKALSAIKKDEIYGATVLAIKSGLINSDDYKILHCIANAVR